MTSLVELKKKKEELLKEMNQLEKEIEKQEKLESPYVANVDSTSGHFFTRFKTEEKARKKLEEYRKKKEFRSGTNFGVFLYKQNADGTKDLLEIHPVYHKKFDAAYIAPFLKKD